MTEVAPPFGFVRTKVLSVDVAQGLHAIEGLDGYVAVAVVVRWGDEPVGMVHVPVRGKRVTANDLLDAIADELADDLVRVQLCDALAGPVAGRRLDVGGRPPDRLEPVVAPSPSICVAVCTRDRPDQLRRCLTALLGQQLAPALLVVDNAPSTDATRRLVADEFPSVSYVVEPRPGLDHARNRAIAECAATILAFTDDDVEPDAGWTRAIVAAFADEPELAALTGLVVPAELETVAQDMFERLGGFGRGYRRRWFQATIGADGVIGAGALVSTGECGTGANMAFRHDVLVRCGGFDPALDVGTPTGGGGDLDMFHRVIAAGGVLRYEPAAIVFHVHRRSLDDLRRQIGANGSMWSVIRAAQQSGRASGGDAMRVAKWYVWRRWPKLILRAVAVPNQLPVGLPMAEVRGSLVAISGRPLRRSRLINGAAPRPADLVAMLSSGPGVSVDDGPRIEVATVDLLGPVEAVRRPPMTAQLDVLVTRAGEALGRLRIETDRRAVSSRRLGEAIVDELGAVIVPLRPGEIAADASARLRARAIDAIAIADGADDAAVFSVSVVVATLDRPDDLAACLDLLCAHRTRHRVEVIVVDNNPASGLTGPVVARFPGVIRVDEARRGLAYARNAGFLAADNEVLVATDDDVRVPDGWLDLLIAPFERNDVMAVCGNVVPLELETEAQIEFEDSGGLGKGFAPRRVARQEFGESLQRFPAWELGATANAAFRATVVRRPDIGLMDEALGPGMPSGVGEDSYLLYRIARAGGTIVYEPTAYVRHRHRRTPEELQRQIRAYYSGHLAHNLTTIARDHDLRAIVHLGGFARFVIAQRLRAIVQPSRSPRTVARAQVHGAIHGPWNYVRSQRRVGREGRSL